MSLNNYINTFIYIIKNNKNYNFYYLNLKKNILLIININFLFINLKLYLKLIIKFCYENGFKLLLLNNNLKINIKYNIIINLLKI